MKLSRLQLIAIMMISMSLMMSCRDELCYNHFPRLGVSLSWEYEWERDYGMNLSAYWDASLHGVEYDDLRPGKPEWVNMISFASNGERHEHYMDNEGEEVMVNEGENLNLLLYNGDTEYIILSDLATPPQARASATGRARTSLSYVTEIHPNTRTTNPPDILYSAYVPDVPAVRKHETRQISVEMRPLVYTYLIRYEFEYGFEHVALARGALGGMAESVYLVDCRTSEEETIILYDCELSQSACEAQVRSFGVPGFSHEAYGKKASDIPSRPYTLNLEVRLRNGKYVEFNTDVTDQIARQPLGGVIKVSGLRIEDYQSSLDAGFNITVDDWGDREDIDLPVGTAK